MLASLKRPIITKQSPVVTAENMIAAAIVENIFSPGTFPMVAAMDNAVAERMATGVSCGRLTMPGNELKIPVQRHMIMAPKMVSPAAWGAWAASGPEKMIPAKETSIMTIRIPMTMPWDNAGTRLEENVSRVNSASNALS